MANEFGGVNERGEAPKAAAGFPSWRYGPGGEERVFANEDDVPDGWEDHPSKVKAPKAAKPDEPVERRLGRPELMSALRRRGVQFAPNAGGAELAALLAASEPQPVEVDSNGKALVFNEPEPEKAQAGVNPLDPALIEPAPPPPLEFAQPPEPPAAPQPLAQPAPAAPAPREFPAPAQQPSPPSQPFSAFDHDGDGKDGGGLPDNPPALAGKNKAELQEIAAAEGVEFDSDASNRELREAIEKRRAVG